MNFSRIFLAKITIALAVTISVATYAAGPAAVLPPVPSTVDSITPGELRMHLAFLSSPELGGRYTLSPNFAIAARYIASRLEADGFKGAAENGNFLQTFQVNSAKPDTAKSSVEITSGGKSNSYHFGDFYIANGAGEGSVEGQVVFVGAGISSASQKHDDYAGLDVKGKIVLLLPNASPAGIDRSRLHDNESGQGAAQAHGAVGMMQLPPQRFLDFMKDKGFAERAASRESVQLAQASEGKLPAITLGPDLSEEVLSGLGLNLKSMYELAHKDKLQPRQLNMTVKINVAMQITRITTQNVAGILEGADPKLKDEYVVFSAHYDHLKTSPTGEIYPGADDDGSGTTAILSIAHAMSLDRPKRSVLVMFHAGEELGLLGSEYNTDFAPVVPLDKIVADLNIDMIGRSKPTGDQQQADEHLTDANSVYLVGANRISQELQQISEETNSQFQNLRLDYYYNNPENPERIYYRSDHWNYAKHGIPVIFYFDGVHVDYHKPTDTIDKIDFTKMTKITRLVFETGWRIANLDHRLAITQQ